MINYEYSEDCISRKAAIHAFGEVHPLEYNIHAIKTMIEQLPAVQPTRPKGKWITRSHVYGAAYCSNCNYELKINDTKYCPNCGVKMESEEE